MRRMQEAWTKKDRLEREVLLKRLAELNAEIIRQVYGFSVSCPMG
jgi:hypothetical protein